MILTVILIPILGILFDSFFRKVNKKTFVRINNLDQQETVLNQKQKDVDSKAKNLQVEQKHFDKKVKNFEVEKANFEIISRQQNEKYDKLIKNWSQSVQPVMINAQQDVLKRVTSDISFATSPFLKELKSYKGYLSKNVDFRVPPIVVDEIRHLIFENFKSSNSFKYVNESFNNSVGIGYNPVLTAWELYRLYGDDIVE